MSSGSHKESPRTIRIDPAAINERNHARTLSGGSSHSPAIAVTGPRLSPTLTRSFDTGDADARERQRAMDVDSAMQLCENRVFLASREWEVDNIRKLTDWFLSLCVLL